MQNKKYKLYKKFQVWVVSGTPGTGKSSLAKELSLSMCWDIINITHFIKKHSLQQGYDEERKCIVVSPSKLVLELIRYLKVLAHKKPHIQGVIIEGHLAHLLPNNLIDLCIITKTNLKVLKQRLKKRKYSKEKIQENMDSEIFDICLIEAKEANHKIIVVDTTKLSTKKLVYFITQKLSKKIK